MPFTPFHLGPAAAFKALAGRRFSFMVFGGTQVLMDLEPLIGILQNKSVLHGLTHTLAGALLIGAVAGLIGKPISEFALRLIQYHHPQISWRVSFASAFIGSFSHIALDAIMHADMHPLWPLAQGNAWLQAISTGWLHLLCAGFGFLGVVVLAGQRCFAGDERDEP